MSTSAPHTDTAREFILGLKFRYHHYEHTCEALETEVREVIAGHRRGLIRLKNLAEKRDESFAALRLYLGTICHRLKNDDKRLLELLAEKFGRLNESVHVPLDTENE